MRFQNYNNNKEDYLDSVRKSFQDTLDKSLVKIHERKDGINCVDKHVLPDPNCKSEPSVPPVNSQNFTYLSVPTVNSPSKTVYFAAGWFTDKQNKAYKLAMDAIEKNPTIDRENSYVPLEHQYKGLRVDEHPELLEDKEWATATFNGDCLGIKSSDIFLCTYIPDEEDIGCGVELGLAKSLGKYIVLVIPDEDYGKPINLMSWGVADTAIKMSDLEAFDFNKPEYSFYEGAVY